MSTRYAAALLAAGVFCIPAAAGTHTVTIEGMKYRPETITIERGDTVVWRNADVVPHTATADGRFDSGLIAPGASWSWTATQSGRIGYVCTYHPGMKAAVVVR